MDFVYGFTEDNLKLQGVHYSAFKKDICVVFIHGMGGNAIENYFAYIWGKECSSSDIGFLYGHTRGFSIINSIVTSDYQFKTIGATYEIFEDCLFDIDLWIKQALKLGYKKIILMGHSFGCNKILYYYYKKNPDVLGLVFASAPDMLGLTKINEPDFDVLLKEASQNVQLQQPEVLLHKHVNDDILYSSGTFYNWYQENSNADNFPILRNPKDFCQLASVKVPILAFSGSFEDALYLKLDLLKEKAISCPLFTGIIIPETNHLYFRKEKETADVLISWIQEKLKQ